MRSYSETKANGNREKEQQLVCVTGAGGFIGSWVVKVLLLRGYRVRGTARDPADNKNSYLLDLEGAKERLSVCRADLLDRDNLNGVFRGCNGVFHIASPMFNTDPELMVVAVEGTRNVIHAAADAGVRRVVFTSSYGAVHMDPNRNLDAVLDETCWSDYEFCKQTGNMYCCSKMMAEITATEEAAKRGLELSVVVPSMTIGPALQHKLRVVVPSTVHISRYLTGAKKTCPNVVTAYVDVRDVARAHILVYERPDAHGRYLCICDVLHRAHFLQLLRDLFPYYPITDKCEDDGKPMVKPYRFSNQRLRDLGLDFTPLKESLHETVLSLQQQGHLDLPVIPGPERARL
ncbi:hypothetical protein ZWY2020_023475 [Hordeum vulgare]|nr:hypothetical protein ZWY2020_023473 [Hordeum vulgare]KAI4982983.1 hypothetical protein ZWY2020_023475 [Hordeum vulgare]